MDYLYICAVVLTSVMQSAICQEDVTIGLGEEARLDRGLMATAGAQNGKVAWSYDDGGCQSDKVAWEKNVR